MPLAIFSVAAPLNPLLTDPNFGGSARKFESETQMVGAEPLLIGAKRALEASLASPHDPRV